MSKAVLAKRLSAIEGWLDDGEAWALHRAVVDYPTAPVVVEIGSWKGRSTVALALGVKIRGGRVYAVDPHEGIRRLPELGSDSFPEFRANLRRYAVDRYVEPIRTTSDLASHAFSPGSVDVLFVDASHVYEDVIADIDAWAPRLAEGAIVAFHDVVAYPDVRRALQDRVLCESPFRGPQLVDNTLLVEYRASDAWTSADERRASVVLEAVTSVAPASSA